MMDEQPAEEESARHMRWLRQVKGVPDEKPMSAVDMKALFKDLRFADSKDSIGLQLADIVASTFHRACKGTLQKDGWKPLGALLVSRKKSVVNLIAISADPNVLEKQISSNAHLTDVLFSLKKKLAQ